MTGERLQIEMKNETFEHCVLIKFVLSELILESSTWISFPNPFRDAITF